MQMTSMLMRPVSAGQSSSPSSSTPSYRNPLFLPTPVHPARNIVFPVDDDYRLAHHNASDQHDHGRGHVEESNGPKMYETRQLAFGPFEQSAANKYTLCERTTFIRIGVLVTGLVICMTLILIFWNKEQDVNRRLARKYGWPDHQ